MNDIFWPFLKKCLPHSEQGIVKNRHKVKRSAKEIIPPNLSISTPKKSKAIKAKRDKEKEATKSVLALANL